jgi:hypothetical protein
MIETSINIGGFVIYEPTTVFTDVVISILCFVFVKNLKANTPAVKNWKLFFLFFGLGTFVGACSHAFFNLHAGIAYKSFWLPMQVLNILSVYFAQLGTYHSIVINSKNAKAWLLSYRIQVIVFAIAVFIFHNFLVVVIDNTLGLIPIMVLYYMNRNKNEGYTVLANGIVISFLTVIVHGTKLSLHAYFNSNDIAHILIMFSLYYMYSGVKQFSTQTTQ